MKKAIILLSLSMIVHFAFAQSPKKAQHKTIIYNGPSCDEEYQLIFEEDFSEGPIDTDDWILPPSINDHSPELMDNPWKIWNDPSSLTAEFAEMASIQQGKLVLNACKQTESYRHYVEYPSGNQANLGYTDENGMWRELRASWIGSKLITNHQSASSSNSLGCFQYGKFCIRAKVAKAQNNIWNAFWFFGPTGEIDMFEIYNNDSDLKSNMHMMKLIYECEDYENNGECHSYYDLWDIISGEIDPVENDCTLLDNIKESKAHDLGDLSTQYHEYCLEWTPFKVEWSVDGNVIRTVYQYWYDNGEAWEGLQPYSCLTPGTEYTLYEEMWFPRDHYINMILSLAGNGKPGNHYCGQMKIDEVKVWQKQESFEFIVNGGQPLNCMSQNEEATFELVSDTPFDLYTWEVSSNLEIISNSGNTITVRAGSTNYSSEGWIEVRVPNSKSCYDIIRRHELLVNPGSQNSVYLNQEYEPCASTAVLRLAGPAEDLIDYKIISATATSNHPASQVTLQQYDQYINVTLNSQELSDFIAFEAVLESTAEGCEHTMVTQGTLVMYDCGGYFMQCDQGEEISIYPNPSSGVINFSYDHFDQTLFTDQSFLNQELKIVHGETGQIMDTRLIRNTLNTPMNIQHYPDGIYYIINEVCEGKPAHSFMLSK